MNKWSTQSQDKLNSVHKDLQVLFNKVLQICDCTVIEGHRSYDRQKDLFENGKTKTLKSKHCINPSFAIDVAPYPIDFNDIKRFYYFGGIVKAVSEILDIPIRWGGDWDKDNDLNDQTFNDLVHFELDI